MIDMFYQLDENILEEMQDYLNWNLISRNNLSEEFMERHLERFDWLTLSYTQKFSIEFLKKYGNFIDWNQLSKNDNLTEEIVETFSDKLNWDILSSCFKFNKKNLNKWADKINWYNVFRFNGYAKFNFKHFLKYGKQAKLTLEDYIFTSRSIPEDYIREHLDEIDLKSIFTHSLVSEKFIEEFVNMDGGYWAEVSSFQRLSKNFIKKWQHRIDWYKLNSRNYKQLNEKLLDEMKDYVFWEYLSSERDFSERFLEKHEDLIYWEKLNCKKFSLKFILKHENQLSFDEMILNTDYLRYYLNEK